MRYGHVGEGDQVVLGLLDAQQALGDGDLPAHLIGGGRRIRLLLRGSLGSHYCWPRRCLMPAQVAAKMPLTRPVTRATVIAIVTRSEEHTSELQSLMRISYAVFCLKKKTQHNRHLTTLLNMYNTTHIYTRYRNETHKT